MLIIIRGLPGSGKSTLAEHLTYSLNSTNGKQMEEEENEDA